MLEQRRRDAVSMLQQGMKPAAVAKALKVSLVSVGRRIIHMNRYITYSKISSYGNIMATKRSIAAANL